MEKPLVQYSIKLQDDNFEVSFEVMPLYAIEEIDSRREEINKAISSIELQKSALDKKIEELNCDIERLTNHADGVDYTVAVGCGILCGVIDSFLVGEFDYEGALNKWKGKVNDYVINKAENARVSQTIEKAVENAKRKAALKGKSLTKDEIETLKARVKAGIENKFRKVLEKDAKDGTVNSLRRAITKLEQVFKLPSDHAHDGLKGMNPASHHLADLAHHASPLGLVAAIIGEVFRAGILVDKKGKWNIIWLGFDEDAKKRWLELVIPIVVSGIITWLLNIADSKYKEEIDKNLPKPIAQIVHTLTKTPLAVAVLNSIKNVFTNWWGHLTSDMAGAKSTPGGGMGIPGLFVSVLKEISSIVIPPINKTKLPEIVNEIFVKYRFDMRAELAVFNELGRQSIPVIFGDILVRTFYFVRRLIVELSEKKDYKEVDWKKTIPLNNRTIVRMMTIETGTFTAFDIADAALRSALKNGTPENPLFWKDFVLRVNFVGLGRFAIAVASDVNMGSKRNKIIKERLSMQNKYLMLENAQIFYIQERTLIETKDTADAIMHLYDVALFTTLLYEEKIRKMDEEWAKLSNNIEIIKENDTEFVGEIKELLDY